MPIASIVEKLKRYFDSYTTIKLINQFVANRQPSSRNYILPQLILSAETGLVIRLFPGQVSGISYDLTGNAELISYNITHLAYLLLPMDPVNTIEHVLAAPQARCLARYSPIHPLNHPPHSHPPKTIIPDHIKVSPQNSVNEKRIHTQTFFFSSSCLELPPSSIRFLLPPLLAKLPPFYSSPCCRWSTLFHIRDAALRSTGKSDSCVESCLSSNRIGGRSKNNEPAKCL